MPCDTVPHKNRYPVPRITGVLLPTRHLQFKNQPTQNEISNAGAACLADTPEVPARFDFHDGCSSSSSSSSRLPRRLAFYQRDGTAFAEQVFECAHSAVGLRDSRRFRPSPDNQSSGVNTHILRPWFCGAKAFQHLLLPGKDSASNSNAAALSPVPAAPSPPANPRWRSWSPSLALSTVKIARQPSSASPTPTYAAALRSFAERLF